MANQNLQVGQNLKHQWRVHFVMENWQFCKLCELQRHKGKDGKWYYDWPMETTATKSYCGTVEAIEDADDDQGENRCWA